MLVTALLGSIKSAVLVPIVERSVVMVSLTVPTEASMVPTTVAPRRSMKAAAEALLMAQNAVAARENFILRDECRDDLDLKLCAVMSLLVVSEYRSC